MGMTHDGLTGHDSAAAMAARCGGREALAAALQASRRDTLATFAVYEQALADGWSVPCRPTLNPPLWELGHIGWFQSWWLERLPAAERRRGHQADPEAPRRAPVLAAADALYDSSRVPHPTRWSLPLPDARATRAELARQLQLTLGLLNDLPDDGADSAGSDDALYFFRLALLHEDMHHEAAVYMAQSLGLDLADPRWRPRRLPLPAQTLEVDAGLHRLGRDGSGFAFDNELAAYELPVPGFAIDSQVVRWAEILPFVESGAYADTRWWSAAGQRWLAQTGARPPAPLRLCDGHWQRRLGSRWMALDPLEAACHLSAFEAQAWCAWAGRRLPTEAEWEYAACSRPAEFRWGDVWEWTASDFAPYPGFAAHPYRDYSAPWFDGRPVLRGASWATQPRMVHLRYRNFFSAERTDIVAGFRSCAAV